MVKSTPVRIRLVLVAAFMMTVTIAARTAGQTAAKQEAFPAKLDWHDEEIGISTDPLKFQLDPNPKWTRIDQGKAHLGKSGFFSCDHNVWIL
jgi:hypothetical protein